MLDKKAVKKPGIKKIYLTKVKACQCNEVDAAKRILS